MLYEILKTSKLGASFAPDMYTALWAQKLARDGEVKTLSGAPPLSFQANGQPLLDYLISGNTVQSGTPTPDNPVMPQGTGERTGNLAYGRIDTANVYSNGTIVRAGDYDVAIGRVESGIVYTVNSYVLAFYTDEPTTGSVSYDGSRIVATAGRPTTFTAPITGYVAFRLDSGEQAMLNSGSTALPYEPYGYKIPITCAGQTTPVYLGQTQTVRRVKKRVLTGEENWQWSTGDQAGYVYLAIANATGYAVQNTEICSHFQSKRITGANNEQGIGVQNKSSPSAMTAILVRYTGLTTDAATFKAYLAEQYAAGTPVTVWYVLANEETGIVNEPLMKVGDYADTVSKEQAGVEIPTARGTNTLDVLTDVKPSEIYIKYKS